MSDSKEVYLHLAGNDLILSFDYDVMLKERAKKIHGSRWDKSLMRWVAPLAAYDQIVTSFDNLKISKGVISRLIADAELSRKVEDLKKTEYFEVLDYSSKHPMMGHQKKAFELHRLLEGSCNFGQMGCGKTLSTICAIHWRLLMKQINRALVVCPLSVIKSGWEEQIGMYSDMTFVNLLGNREQRLKKLNQDKNIYIINYEGARLITQELLDRGFDMIVCDECQALKNPLSKQSQACYTLGDCAKYRIALSGSPVGNSAIDFYGTARFVEPNLFGKSFYAFRNKYFKNVTEGKSPIPIYVPKHGAEKEISDKMYSIAFRVLTEEVIELPPQVWLPTRVIPMSPEQDAAYEKMQKELLVELGSQKTVKVTHILTAMMKLTQICSGWVKVPGTGEIRLFDPNPKLEQLKEVVDEIKSPTIIWAYYKADMKAIYDYYSRCRKCRALTNDIIGENCSECQEPIPHRASIVDGSVKDRDVQISRFRFTPEERAEMRAKRLATGESEKQINKDLGKTQNGKELPQTNLFVGQLVASSSGLNLQRAKYAVYFERDWSLFHWTQSLARNHRMGSVGTVFYLNLVCSRSDGSETVDQKILDALKRKENLAQRMNKDDLKIILGNFKKKDKEALKIIDEMNIDFDVDEKLLEISLEKDADYEITLESSEVKEPLKIESSEENSEDSKKEIEKQMIQKDIF